MGALKPWHLSVLCCLLVVAAVVAGVAVLIRSRKREKRD